MWELVKGNDESRERLRVKVNEVGGLWIDGYPLRPSQGPSAPLCHLGEPTQTPPPPLDHWNYPSLRSTHPSSAVYPELGHSGRILGTRSQDRLHPLGQVRDPAEGSSRRMYRIRFWFKNGIAIPFKGLQSGVLSSLETRNRKRELLHMQLWSQWASVCH